MAPHERTLHNSSSQGSACLSWRVRGRPGWLSAGTEAKSTSVFYGNLVQTSFKEDSWITQTKEALK